MNIYCKNYKKINKYTTRKNVVFIFTCRDRDSDYWAIDGEVAAAGSTYHWGPRSAGMWRRDTDVVVTTLSRNLARQSPSDAAPHHSRMETSQLQRCENLKSSNLLKVSHPHISYYMSIIMP